MAAPFARIFSKVRLFLLSFRVEFDGSYAEVSPYILLSAVILYFRRQFINQRMLMFAKKYKLIDIVYIVG